MVLFCAAGCSKSLEERTNSGVVYYHPVKEETGNDRKKDDGQQDEEELFLILSNDSAEETLRLYCYADEAEYQYYYGLSTQFLDKYGNASSAVNFTAGKAVYLGRLNSQGKLSRIQMADEVWEYEGVTRFSVDESRDIFQIADTRYRFGEGAFVFSNGDRIDLSQVTDNDRLSVVGRDKNILSVVVTTGHGTLQLSNTELFEGSHLQLGRRIFAEITPDMAMELPEGDYRLTVANDGWGGSCDIQIQRGQTTTMDLDTIKGEGPKYGKVLFAVNAPDAQVTVDGQVVDASAPLDLRYGRHAVEITAPGYSEWSKYLVVNSPEATIVIDLEGGMGGSSSQNTDKKNDSQSSSGTDNKEGNTQSSSGTDKEEGNTQSSSGTGQGTEGSKGSSDKNQGAGNSQNSSGNDKEDKEDSTEDLLKDYLSTMQNMYIYDKLYQMPGI